MTVTHNHTRAAQLITIAAGLSTTMAGPCQSLIMAHPNLAGVVFALASFLMGLMPSSLGPADVTVKGS